MIPVIYLLLGVIISNCPVCKQKLLVNFVPTIRHAVCASCGTGIVVNAPRESHVITESDKKGSLRLDTQAIFWQVKFDPKHVRTSAAREQLIRDLAVGRFGLKFQLYLRKGVEQDVQDIFPKVIYNVQDESAVLEYSTGYVGQNVLADMLASLREIFRPYVLRMG